MKGAEGKWLEPQAVHPPWPSSAEGIERGFEEDPGIQVVETPQRGVTQCKQGVEEMIGGLLSDQEVIPINGSEEAVDELYKKHSLKCSAKKKKEKGVRTLR